MADSSQHSIYIAEELTYGSTLVDPAMDFFRHTGTTLGVSKASDISDELRPDRQIADFRHSTLSVTGEVSAELSFGGVFDAALEAVLMGTWAADVVDAGVQRRSFHVLRQFGDLSASAKPYHLFKGCEFNTLNLTIPTSGKVTAGFGMIGKNLTVLENTTSLGAGATFGNPTANQTFNGLTGSIQEDGLTISIISEVSLSITNNLEPRYAIGTDETLFPSSGRINLTGSMTAYFENAVLLEKFLNESSSSLDFTLVDPDGNSYSFEIPNIKYTDGQPPTSGEGAITINLSFQAIYDPATQTNIRITRAAI